METPRTSRANDPKENNMTLQKTLKREETDSDGQLGFDELVHYLQDYEKDLKFVVESLDQKNAGMCLSVARSGAGVPSPIQSKEPFCRPLQVASTPRSSCSRFETSACTSLCVMRRTP